MLWVYLMRRKWRAQEAKKEDIDREGQGYFPQKGKKLWGKG